MRIIIFFILVLHIISCSGAGRKSDLVTVEFVDLKRYTGLWYEIARYPNNFQKDCFGSRATYSILDDGTFSVLNECYDSSFKGKLKSVQGKALVADTVTNAKLKVSFFWPFYGDYWIIDLGRNYDYAVVGHPERKYLWILSRTKVLDKNLYEEILKRLHIRKYDTTKLVPTPQD